MPHARRQKEHSLMKFDVMLTPLTLRVPAPGYRKPRADDCQAVCGQRDPGGRVKRVSR